MRLVRGEGHQATNEACWISALHFYTRQDETWSDQAPWACVSPLIRELCMWFNDFPESDEEREFYIGPHLFAPLGTAASTEIELRRIDLIRERVGWIAGAVAYSSSSISYHPCDCGACGDVTDPAVSATGALDEAERYLLNDADHPDETCEAISNLVIGFTRADRAGKNRDAINSWALQLILDLCAIGERVETVPTCSIEKLGEQIGAPESQVKMLCLAAGGGA